MDAHFKFEAIGEDLNMSDLNVNKKSQAHTLPDISRELAILGLDKNLQPTKEAKRMYPIGTKVAVRANANCLDTLTGRVGTVCKHFYDRNIVGVMFDNYKNPGIKEGFFLLQMDSLMVYRKASPIMTADAVKSVIFSGRKTIVQWNDGTKTIVTCGQDDIFDPYAGFCAAIAKKVFGSTTSVKRILKTVAKEQQPKKKKENLGLETKPVPDAVYCLCSRQDEEE